MKRMIFTLSLLLAYTVASFGEVTIIGPDQLDVKEADLFYVEGITAEQFSQCTVRVYPDKDKPQVLVLQTLNSLPVLYVKGRSAGSFAMILDVNVVGNYQLVIHELKIGGNEPDPGPIPPLPPGQKWKVVIVYETDKLDNLTKDQRTVINSLKFRKELEAKGHQIVKGGIADQHVTGDLSGDLEASLAECKGKSLPRICIIPVSGGEVKSFPLPKDVRAVMELLNKGGV